MYPSPRINVPASHSSPSIFPCRRAQDKFLSLSLSPASLHSLSSDTSDGDELDEQEVWCMETSRKKTKSSAHVSLPPIVSAKAGSARSPSTATSIGKTSGILHSSVSPVCNSGSAICVFRVLSGETMANSRTSSASRMIDAMVSKNPHQSGGLMVPRSAPLNIPDWSRVQLRGDNSKGVVVVVDDDDDDSDDHLPPHEYLAKQYAKTGQIPFSVLEGAGRTLKGRDLCRVRDAVFTCTGFMG